MDIGDQNIQIYLLVPPSEENLVTINRLAGGKEIPENDLIDISEPWRG